MPNRQSTGKRAREAAVASTVADLRRALLRHYDGHRRRLPWRGENEPYRILVSEVMLQQTRVDTVLDYYGAWLARFPDFEALASAELDDVLEAWEGLGYYRRARNLHRTARMVREREDGALPATYAGLRELPGVGDYTAGAVASIAFGEVVPAADGNVRRVLSRLFDEADPAPAWVRETAGALVDPDRPGDWNQAVMELGATVCTPRSPACGRCPLAGWCAARAAGTQAERPAPKARRAPRKALLATAVLVRGGRVRLERRPADGLLGDMWAFPEAEVSAEAEAPEAALALARARADGPLHGPEPLPSCRHRFTHIAATYLPYLMDVVGSEGRGPHAEVGERPPADALWVDLAGPVSVALPVAQRRILDSVREHVGARVA